MRLQWQYLFLLCISSVAIAAPQPQSYKRERRALQRHLIHSYIEEAAAKERLDPKLIQAIVQVESNFNHKAVSRVGARGLMQIMPGTAEELGDVRALDRRNPRANIFAGVRYLRTMINLFSGDLKLAIAAYNAGPQAVQKYKGIPPYAETRDYVKKVMGQYRKLTFALPPPNKR
jgi:soluble lytic murein transglycosylase-like protein